MTRQVQLIRFAVVGVAVALTYIALYLLLLAVGVAPFVANAAAFFIAIVVQYALQAAFTFERPLADRGQILRFAIMVGLGFATSAVITGPVALAFALPAWLAAAAVTVVLPVQNYFLMSIWVFADPSSSCAETS